MVLREGVSVVDGSPLEGPSVAHEPDSLVDARELAGLLAEGRHDAVERLLQALPAAEGRGDGLVGAAGGDLAGYLDVAVNALQPALYEVGRLWQTQRIGVAEEHLATSTALHALTAAFVRARARTSNGRSAAFACVEGNLHDLGVRILADAFELAGWQAHALGASTPTRDLVAFVERTAPDLVGLSVALPEHVGSASRAIAELREALGSGAPAIVVGGLSAGRLAEEGLVGADAVFADARQALEGT